MRVLLVYTNRNRYITPPPVGLAYLIKPLLEQGHTVKVLDLMFSKNPTGDLEFAIANFKPELAGFSIRNLDNQSLLNLKNPLPEIKEFINIAKNKGVEIVLGGTAFSSFPVEMLQFMGADYGIAGQGEKSLPLLVEAIEKKKETTRIAGLVYRQGETIAVNPPILSGYAGEEKADWSFIDMKPYKRAFLTPPAAVIVKTGCPYQCSYCDSRATMGGKTIFREIDQIIDDIKIIKKIHQVHSFFLIDPCFNSPLNSAKELLAKIIKADLKIRFIASIEPIHHSFDVEFFKLFSRAGGYFSMPGMDSFSDKMLENYRKPFTVADIYNFGQLATEQRLKFGVELLFGGPGETHETIKESMAFLPRVDYTLCSYALGIRIMPNTALFETAINEGLIKDSSELFFPKFYVSKDLNIEWAQKYITQAVSKYAYRDHKMAPLAFKNFLERFTG